MKTQDTDEPIDALRCLCRYETRGGYVWAGVMRDGELMCVPCLRGNYRQIFRATRGGLSDGWAVASYDYSGASETTEYCAHCGEVIWEIEPS
jgi:hypothetical protein